MTSCLTCRASPCLLSTVSRPVHPPLTPVRVTADLLVMQGSVGSSGQEVCTRSMRPVRMLLVEKVAESMVTRLPFSMRGGTLTKRAPRRT